MHVLPLLRRALLASAALPKSDEKKLRVRRFSSLPRAPLPLAPYRVTPVAVGPARLPEMADDDIAATLAAAALSDPAQTSADATAPAAGEQVVTPWDVQGGAGGIDYDKLLTTFGCQPIDANLIARCVYGCCAAPAPF